MVQCACVRILKILMMIMHHPNTIGVTQGSHSPIAFVQRQKMDRSLQNGTKTGHVAQSESLNLL